MNFSEFRRTGPISIIDPNVLDADSYGADTSIFLDDAGRPRIFSTRWLSFPFLLRFGSFPRLGKLVRDNFRNRCEIRDIA